MAQLSCLQLRVEILFCDRNDPNLLLQEVTKPHLLPKLKQTSWNSLILLNNSQSFLLCPHVSVRYTVDFWGKSQVGFGATGLYTHHR